MQRFPLSVVLAAFSSLVTKLGVPNVDMVEKDKYMGFKIGQHICHVSLKKPRNIRQMMFNKDGELLLGTGTKTTGWLFAKDCVRTSQLPKVMKVPA